MVLLGPGAAAAPEKAIGTRTHFYGDISEGLGSQFSYTLSVRVASKGLTGEKSARRRPEWNGLVAKRNASPLDTH